MRIERPACFLTWVTVLLLCAAGCEKTPEDHVIDQYRKGEAAIAEFDIEAYKATLSPISLGTLADDLITARKATEAEMKSLRPSTMMIVLALRNRQAAQYLKTMTADDYLVWLMQQGFLVVDAESDIYPYEVTFQGDKATLTMGIRIEVRSSRGFRYGRRRGGVIGLAAALVPRSQLEPLEDYKLSYQKINGVWLSDGEALARAVDEAIIDAAAWEEMKVPDYLAFMERESFGSLKDNIWSPQK